MSEPRTPCAPRGVLEVAQLLRSVRFDLATEAATQLGILRLLVEAYGEDRVSREHRLGPGDRPDFLVAGCIVVEVKRFRRTTARASLRQLDRYAAYPQVAALVLATAHAAAFPPELAGKPLLIVSLGSSWL